ncbi:hypothetical protein IW140_004936 [Coemansia sp. RSA 1813]|nr:hypothetical protein EV178_004911 [Coemansia sp. RSA 1646]KAJ1770051.1 hypothetical protein LPJ74_003492 [Coemansia sp. RSA 1843]KAJ2087447.1 hypothetical protein IW138_004985 [Coemansia sp. RSA 986]KAJ2212437.1 hypothetical protein EV179_004690 [Coemansia sp. RSA 487]KAJ2566393.1 hypothetical protein IW140_004936 [Coemansia sp. RSA 1813]
MSPSYQTPSSASSDTLANALVSTTTDTPNVKTLQDLIAALNQTMGDNGLGDDPRTVRQAKKLMQSYVSHSNDWSQYAVYHEGARYTRSLVDDGNGKYNLLILVWGEEQSSPIHDHAGSHCMMKLLAGELNEDLYAWPASTPDSTNLRLKRTAPLKTNSVAYMSDKLGLHRIANPSKGTKAVSLHLYSPPYEMCKVFNEETGASVQSSCSAERLRNPVAVSASHPSSPFIYTCSTTSTPVSASLLSPSSAITSM